MSFIWQKDIFSYIVRKPLSRVRYLKMQKPAPAEGKVRLAIVTHTTREFSVRAAVAKINTFEDVAHVDAVLRVIS